MEETLDISILRTWLEWEGYPKEMVNELIDHTFHPAEEWSDDYDKAVADLAVIEHTIYTLREWGML